MVRGLSLREKRLIEEQRKRDAGEGSSVQTLAQRKGKGKVTDSAAITLRSSPISRPPPSSTKQGGNRKRKADAQDAGKEVEAVSRKKAERPSVAAVPEPVGASISPSEVFSRLVCAGESMPKSSELRHSSEYNDIVRLNCRMIAQVNKLTARYEEDIAKAEGEACRARSELEEEKGVYKSLRSSLHDQISSTKEECKLLVEYKDAELASRGSELEALKEKLKGFEMPKDRMEAEIREACLGKINSLLADKFQAIKDRLDMLRGDTTMDFVNYNQAKNNLEFIEDADQTPDLTVSSEKRRLKEEMARYADSEANFDRVLDEIEGELKFLPISFEREKTALSDLGESIEPEPVANETEVARTPPLEDSEVRSEQAPVDAEHTRVPVESEAVVDVSAKVAETRAEQSETQDNRADLASGEEGV